MKKILSITLGLLFIGSIPVFAETDPIALNELRDIRKGEDNRNQIEDLRVEDTATIGGVATIAGITSSADIDAGTNQVEADQLAISTNGTEVGYLIIGSVSQLWFVVSGNTNILDTDIDN